MLPKISTIIYLVWITGSRGHFNGIRILLLNYVLLLLTIWQFIWICIRTMIKFNMFYLVHPFFIFFYLFLLYNWILVVQERWLHQLLMLTSITNLLLFYHICLIAPLVCLRFVLVHKNLSLDILYCFMMFNISVCILWLRLERLREWDNDWWGAAMLILNELII